MGRMRVVFCLLASLAVSVAEPQPPPALNGAEQDAQGVLWAFQQRNATALFAFENGQWNVRPQALEAGNHTMPVRMARLNDGAVVCVWRLDKSRLAVTRHLGTESSLLASGTGTVSEDVNNAPLLQDSKNRLWIVGKNGEVHHMGLQDKALATYRIQAADLWESPDKKPYRNWNVLFPTEDGKGRVWLWTGGAVNYASLRGVLVFDDGDKPERHDITGIKGTRFSALTRKDAAHLWLGVLGDGLYTVDIDTFAAEKVPVPDENAFRKIESAFTEGEDLYVVTKPPWQSTLWRLRGDHWERLADNLDHKVTPNYCRVPVSNGFLLCAQPYPWFIGKEGKALAFDWRNGFPIEGVLRLIPCADGRFFGIGQRETILHQRLDLPPKAPQAVRVCQPDLRNVWTIGAAGHFWALPRRNEPKVLKEWDGSAWREYPLPPNTEVYSIGNLASDQAGRIWLLPNSDEQIAAFLDPRDGQWRTFPKIETAFESFRNDPPRFLNPRRWNYIPQYSAEGGRIAFRSEQWQVVYFDGTSWKRWKRKEISQGKDNMVGVPFFNAEGTLCVNVDKATWALDGETGWHETAFENRFPADEQARNYSELPPLTLPEGCVTGSPDSIVQDNQGTLWFTWNGALYKCAENRCVNVFPDAEPNPFATRRYLESAWVGPEGTAFVKAYAFESEWFQIAPKFAPPRTSVNVMPGTNNTVCVKIQVQSDSKTRVRWRIDQEPWQEAKALEFPIEHLPNGPHTVEARAIDESLQSDAVPAVAKFDVQTDPEKQIAALVEELSNPDFARRKAAIAALARQPERAATALRAARENADEDLRWWIDAALRQIEHAKAAGAEASK